MKKILLLLSIVFVTATAFGQATGYPLSNFTTSGSIGSASTTVDVYSRININQTTPSITLTIPNPTNITTKVTEVWISNKGTVPFTLSPGGVIDTACGVILKWIGTKYYVVGKTITPDLSAYMPLAGGTFTGNVNGVTPTQLTYLNSLSSNVQTQLNSKITATTADNDYVRQDGGSPATTGQGLLMGANIGLTWNQSTGFNRVVGNDATGFVEVKGNNYVYLSSRNATNEVFRIRNQNGWYTSIFQDNLSNTSVYMPPSGGTLALTSDIPTVAGVYEPVITAGTTAQYWRGDKTWQTLNTAGVPELTNLYYTDARARAAISLTTTGSSGSATYSSGVLNVPTYTLAGLGGIGLTSLSATSPLAYDNSTGVFSMPAATTSLSGYLNTTDWNTFNNKQATLVSGTNLKTVNGTTLLGSGDLGIIDGTHGGTGINNSTRTLTYAGNVVFTGAFNATFAVPQSTTWTLPNTASETLAGLGTAQTFSAVNTFSTSSGTEIFNLKIRDQAAGSYLTAMTSTVAGRLDIGTGSTTTQVGSALTVTGNVINNANTSCNTFRNRTGVTLNINTQLIGGATNDILIASGDVTSGAGTSGSTYINTGTSTGTRGGGLGLFTSTGSFGGGVNVLFMANMVTAPTSNPTGGFVNWAAGGDWNLRTSGGGIVRLGATSTIPALVGVTDGSAAASGIIGEVISGAQDTYTNYTTTATYQNITSVTLTAGSWLISGQATYYANAATLTAGSDAIFVIGTTTASASGVAESKKAYVPQATLLGTSHESAAITSYVVNVSGTTTYYLNTQSTFTLGNPQFVGTISATRIR